MYRSNGMTAPNPAAQEKLLRKAYDGLAARDVAYIEAHGTGTRLGDPIELEALGRVVGAGSGRTDACPIGSIKSCIGHLECAAGMAAVIKSAMAVKERRVPPTMHVTKPNHFIDFDRIQMQLATDVVSLPATGPFLIGLSGFGFGGTNSHVVLRPLEELTTDEATLTRAMPTAMPGTLILPTTAKVQRLALLGYRHKFLSTSFDQAGQLTRPPMLLLLSSHSHAGLLAEAEAFATQLRPTADGR